MYFAVYRRLIVLVVAGMALAAVAQTNSFPQYERWFILPKPHLRTGFTEPAELRSDSGDEQVNLSSLPAELRSAHLRIQRSEPKNANVDQVEGNVQRYYLRQPGFGLIPPARISDNLMVRAFDSVFQPEEVHVGRTATVSCSIWTAIIHKNPSCLLNPIIVNVSW